MSMVLVTVWCRSDFMSRGWGGYLWRWLWSGCDSTTETIWWHDLGEIHRTPWGITKQATHPIVGPEIHEYSRDLTSSLRKMRNFWNPPSESWKFRGILAHVEAKSSKCSMWHNIATARQPGQPSADQAASGGSRPEWTKIVLLQTAELTWDL